MPKVPITATESEHGEANWSAKPSGSEPMTHAPRADEAELQMLSYLRRIVDAQERISLAVVNISTIMAERNARAPVQPPSSSVSDS